jgi:outer membrane lipoprotein-sorting protein
MRRLLLIATLAASALVLLATPEETPLTVDQIVQKHVEALGGAAKLNSIQSLVVTGTVSILGQTEAPLTIQVKRPNLMRLEMTFQGRKIVQAFDGTTAWTINPMVSSEPKQSSEEDTRAAQESSDFIGGNLVDYKSKGNTVELVDKETLEGVSVYKLKITKRNGSIEYDYLDAKSFLPIRTEGRRTQLGQEILYESKIANYKPVEGVLMPFSLTQLVNGRLAMEIAVEKMDANVPLDPAVFKMPEKPAQWFARSSSRSKHHRRGFRNISSWSMASGSARWARSVST